MLELEEIRQRLRQESIAEVAEATGLHYNTPRFIRDGRLDNPTLKTMKALSAYFERKGGEAE